MEHRRTGLAEASRIFETDRRAEIQKLNRLVSRFDDIEDVLKIDCMSDEEAEEEDNKKVFVKQIDSWRSEMASNFLLCNLLLTCFC